MVDLVGTCPKDFWQAWIREGDPAGSRESGEEWSWFTRDHLARKANVGDRFYIVAHGKLRGYAPITRVIGPTDPDRPPQAAWIYAICRKGNAVAVTIPEPIPGFQGLRTVWWGRDSETPFMNWMQP